MPAKGKDKPVDNCKTGNHLIDSLRPAQRKSFVSQCERVEIDLGGILCEPGVPFPYAYFPLSGSIILVNAPVGRQPLETESIGNEGMLGATLVLGINRAAQRGIVQAPCLALRMKPRRLRTALQSHPALHRAVQHYLYVVHTELSHTAACIRFHDVAKRLARSLLLAHDRAPADDLFLTQQVLADKLGVRRGAVTLAAFKWQREGIIRYSRGIISILDRKRLEGQSCGCYDASIENYTRILS